MDGGRGGGRESNQPAKRPIKTTGAKMITASLSDMTFSKGFLHVGLVVRGERDCWIRFVKIEIPVLDLNVDALSQALNCYMDTERAAAEQPSLF